MRRPFHKENPAIFEQIKKEVRSVYPNLHFYLEDSLVFIRGTFPVIYEGTILDRYSIEIELPRDYPESIPIVREVGGLIPHTSDYHMNKAGVTCLFLPEDHWRVYPPDSTLLDFLKGPVHNFFLGQSHVRLGQPWPFGQWSHGSDGIREYYTELLGTNNLITIIKYLEYLRKPKLKGHWYCPCESGKRLRNCHVSELQDISVKIPSRIALQSLKSLTSKKT